MDSGGYERRLVLIVTVAKGGSFFFSLVSFYIFCTLKPPPVLPLYTPTRQITMSRDPARPNVVLALADNLGWGELGCYRGGTLRGAATPRMDKLATEGLLLHNFNVETECVPTRSALMTGRHPIRTGCRQSVPAGFTQGLTPWEKTLAECFKRMPMPPLTTENDIWEIPPEDTLLTGASTSVL